MRRMLDPKEVGGSTAPARHGYMVVMDHSCYYEVYTTKDYDFKVGQYTQVNNIRSDEYKELYKPGYYPCGGYFDWASRKILACTLQFLYGDTFKVSGLDLKDPSQNMLYNAETELSNRIVRIVKLF